MTTTIHNQQDPLIKANEARVSALGIPRVMQPLKGPFSASVPVTTTAQPTQPTSPSQSERVAPASGRSAYLVERAVLVHPAQVG